MPSLIIPSLIVPSLIVPRACGRPTENVLAVFDGEVLEVAEPGVDALERFIRRCDGVDASVAGEARTPGCFDDQSGKPLAPAAVESIGLRIFVEQEFESVSVATRSARGQRRRQMADGHAGNAALGLRRLAGVADDERVDHWQRSGHNFRKTRARQRHRFAGQPFQRAVCAHMDEGVDARHVLQPQAKGDECMTRR